MSKLDMVRDALAQLGEVSAQTLSSHIEQKHGVKIEPKVIPILRASLRELEMLSRFRQQSQLLAAQLVEQPVNGVEHLA